MPSGASAIATVAAPSIISRGKSPHSCGAQAFQGSPGGSPHRPIWLQCNTLESRNLSKISAVGRAAPARRIYTRANGSLRTASPTFSLLRLRRAKPWHTSPHISHFRMSKAYLWQPPNAHQRLFATICGLASLRFYCTGAASRRRFNPAVNPASIQVRARRRRVLPTSSPRVNRPGGSPDRRRCPGHPRPRNRG